MISHVFISLCLSFAGGTMLYIICDEIIPNAKTLYSEGIPLRNCNRFCYRNSFIFIEQVESPTTCIHKKEIELVNYLFIYLKTVWMNLPYCFWFSYLFLTAFLFYPTCFNFSAWSEVIRLSIISSMSPSRKFSNLWVVTFILWSVTLP